MYIDWINVIYVIITNNKMFRYIGEFIILVIIIKLLLLIVKSDNIYFNYHQLNTNITINMNENNDNINGDYQYNIIPIIICLYFIEIL